MVYKPALDLSTVPFVNLLFYSSSPVVCVHVCVCVCVCVCADSREAMYAGTLISAALAYDIAVACREKQLPNCPCSSDLPFITRLPNDTTLLGGCGDNVAYAADTVRSFVHGDSSEEEGTVREEMKTHNHDLAMEVSNVVMHASFLLLVLGH